MIEGTISPRNAACGKATVNCDADTVTDVDTVTRTGSGGAVPVPNRKFFRLTRTLVIRKLNVPALDVGTLTEPNEIELGPNRRACAGFNTSPAPMLLNIWMSSVPSARSVFVTGALTKKLKLIVSVVDSGAFEH